MGLLLLHIAAGRQSLLFLFKFVILNAKQIVILTLSLPKGKDPRISFGEQRLSSAA
jgi:hypothetical protein